jgi:hypothetical protein
MIAHQIAGKAVRDAMFLSQFSIAVLPRMVVVASVVSLVAVLLANRLLRRYGPTILVPGSFGISGFVLLLVSITNQSFPRVAAVGLYFHVAVFGAILVSWFWSLLNECFDARTARTHIARIAAGGTFGGVVGGVTAERVGAIYSPGAMVLILAGLQVVCALMVTGIVTQTSGNSEAAHAEAATGLFGFRILGRSTYLRDLALLVFLGTLAASFVDFAFKVHATQSHVDPHSLLRFFAGFYTIAALMTFVVQTVLVSRLLTAPHHLSRNVSVLPGVVVVGGLASLLMPGLAVLAAVRGLESIVRNSVFRSSYEVLFNPVSAAQKRATKTMIDVGFHRLGDFCGGGLIQAAVVMVGVAVGVTYLLMLAVLVAAVAVWRARRLHGGYVAALAGVIREKIPPTAGAHEWEQASCSFFLSDFTDLRPTLLALATADPQSATSIPALSRLQHRDHPHVRDAGLPIDVADPVSDPDLRSEDTMGIASQDATLSGDSVETRILDLQSNDTDRVRQALDHSEPLTDDMIPRVVPLLAWDPVYPSASKALQGVVEDHVDLLIETVVDPSTDFAIRRRLPPILAIGSSPHIVEALLRTLTDKRFEVRYQAALALARMRHRLPDLVIDRARVLAAIAREAQVDQRMWNRRRLLDATEGAEEMPFYRQVLRNRTHKSLDHLFHLLSLTFPREPLRVAYDGLHTEEPMLRATSLEYLESILPATIRHSLWPLLGASQDLPITNKSERELLESLLLSHESILLQLEELTGQ